MRRYTLRPPTTEDLRCGARWLRRLDDNGIEAGERDHCARVALPPKWRTRDRLRAPLWPAQTPDTIHTWAAIGASDALSRIPNRVRQDQPGPHAAAYAAAYVAVFGAYMQDQTRELTNTERREMAVGQLQSDLGGRMKIYQSLLEASESEIVRFLTEAEHVITTSKNDKLLTADRKSLLSALGEAAAARLSINPTMGEAYLIPRKGKIAFQPGYKGLVRLAYRSGEIDSIHVDVAYAGERYRRTGGTSPGIDHTPDDDHRTGNFEDIIGAYAVVWLKGSSRPLFRAITKATLAGAAEASGDPRDKNHSDVWRSHPEAMCFKTALIRVANLLPRSDKFRDFHMVAQHETLREVNVEPPPIAGLAGLQDAPALPAAPEPAREALCSGKAQPIADSIRKLRAAYVMRSGVTAEKVWGSVLRKLVIPGNPEPEQLTIKQGADAKAAIKQALAKLPPVDVIEPELVDHLGRDLGEVLPRQPGEDDPADVEPPADWTGHGNTDDNLDGMP